MPLAVLTRAVPTRFASMLFLYDDAVASRRRGSIELRHVRVARAWTGGVGEKGHESICNHGH